MNSSKVEPISKRAQTFILRQQCDSVEKTAKIVGKSVNYVKDMGKKEVKQEFARKPFFYGSIFWDTL